MAKDSLVKTEALSPESFPLFSLSVKMVFKPEEKKDYMTVYFSSEILMREDKQLSSLYYIKLHPTLLPGLAGNPVPMIFWRSLSRRVVRESLWVGAVLQSACTPLGCASWP